MKDTAPELRFVSVGVSTYCNHVFPHGDIIITESEWPRYILTYYSVITGRHFSFDEFCAINPSVKSDYSGLSISAYYCISTYEGDLPPGFPGWVSSTSKLVSSIPLSTSPSTENKVSMPSPIQTGMLSTCNQFYKVIAGDMCHDIANDHGILLASFYAWNPAVKTDCCGLDFAWGVKSTSSSAVVTATTSVSGVTTPSQIRQAWFPRVIPFTTFIPVILAMMPEEVIKHAGLREVKEIAWQKPPLCLPKSLQVVWAVSWNNFDSNCFEKYVKFIADR